MTKPKRKRKARGLAAEPKAAVTLAGPTQWDLGASGPQNRIGMVLEERGDVNPVTGKKENPNGVRGVRRIDNIEVWHNCFIHGQKNRAWITTEQYNTALRIRDAYEMTLRAPGTDYAKPKVDSSPKPDHAVTIQMDRFSKLHEAAKGIHPGDVALIWHCVINGQPPSTFRVSGRSPFVKDRYGDGMPALRNALDRASQSIG